MRTRFKYIASAIGIVVVLYLSYRLFSIFLFGGTFEKKYSRKDAIENYNKREKEITDLVNYFTSIVPANKDVTFGFGKDNNRFDIGIALPNGAVDATRPNIGGSNLKLNSDKTDSILALLNWSNETVDTLKRKLKKSGCKNVMSGNPLRIEYRYSGMGLHSYLIFNKPIADSTVKMYNSELGDTVIRKNVVVLYTSSL